MLRADLLGLLDLVVVRVPWAGLEAELQLAVIEDGERLRSVPPVGETAMRAILINRRLGEGRMDLSARQTRQTRQGSALFGKPQKRDRVLPQAQTRVELEQRNLGA